MLNLDHVKIRHRSSFGDVQKWTPPTFNEVPILDPGLVLKKGYPPGGRFWTPISWGITPKRGHFGPPNTPKKVTLAKSMELWLRPQTCFSDPKLDPPLLFDPNLDPPGGYPPYFWSNVQNDRIK